MPDLGLTFLRTADRLEVINTHLDRPHMISDAQMAFLAEAVGEASSGVREPRTVLDAYREGFAAGLKLASGEGRVVAGPTYQGGVG
jgi:hypothetical protein